MKQKILGLMFNVVASACLFYLLDKRFSAIEREIDNPKRENDNMLSEINHLYSLLDNDRVEATHESEMN